MIEEVMMVAGVLAEVVVVKVVSVAVVMIKVMVMEVLEVPGGGGGVVLINFGSLCAAHKP